MPYITDSQRNRISPYLNDFWSSCPIKEPGEMNYVITTLLEFYRNGKSKYNLFNEIMGILTCVSQEYYRRIVAEYEDEKLDENGDVYHWWEA
jgi:hypothetical protein